MGGLRSINHDKILHPADDRIAALDVAEEQYTYSDNFPNPIAIFCRVFACCAYRW